jgi:tetratricopeptide (TPR) repeat protein
VPARLVITVRRAAAVAAFVAVLVYLTALGNGFVLDDEMIVQRNPAAHSVGAALSAFDQPYWPPQHGAGLYRPLVILSFAADWQLSGGSTLWLHAVNVAWHVAATALLVPILAVYVGPAGALAGGVVFAVHPVHVEAVANLVGRSELMAAAFLFAAVLLARAARRRRAAGRWTLPLEGAVMGAVALALLSKEHAAVAIALLALDDLATRERVGPALPWRTYAATAVLTAVWFVVRRAVEENVSFGATAPTFFGLGTLGRLSTMMPVVFVLVRLLVWPFDLSPDYHPRVVERLEHITPLGAAGAVLLVSLAVLAFALWRRNRNVSVGLLIIGIAWLPTANLLFPSGVVIAERTLYLASAGVALIAAEGAVWVAGRGGVRRAVLAVALVAAFFGARTATANGTWHGNRDLVLRALIAHPESYRVHEAAGRVLVKLGDMPRALAEYGISVELYPLEIANLVEAARVAADAGNARLAGRYLDQAERVGLRADLIEWVRAYVLLRIGSASEVLDHAHHTVAAVPTDPQAARILAAAFLALGQPDSARAVWPAFRRRGGSPYLGWLYGSSTFAAVRMLDSARMAFDSAAAHAPADPSARADLGRLRALIGGLAEAAAPLR